MLHVPKTSVSVRARIIAGAAAVLFPAVWASSAAAADLGIAPVDYVTTCDAHGLGFLTIPGTDTCLRISGRLRADYNVFEYDELFRETQGPFGFPRDTNAYRMRARANVYFDTRTTTEFGLLRTYTDFQLNSDFARSSMALSSAYISFGDVTFGRDQSRYDYVDAFFAPGQAFLSAVSDVTTNLVAYTADLGSGFSVTAAVEDNTHRRQDVLAAPGFASGYGGTEFPDFVGNARIEKDWGTAQVMGALHQVRPTGVSEDALGFAVGGGAVFNIPTGRGTVAGFQGTYSEGALQYVSSSLAGGRRINGTFFGPADAIIDGSGNLQLSNGFSAMAGFATGLTARTSLSFEAGYARVDQPLVDLSGDGVGDDLDFQSFALDGSIGFSPVSGFLLAVGAQYMHVDMDEGPDFGGFSAFFRAQRLF